MTERAKIVRWLRDQDDPQDPWTLAAAIEVGEHLKKPEPTIPVSEWIDNPSAG